MPFLCFGSLLFFSPGQDPKSLKNASGFSLIRFRLKVWELFLKLDLKLFYLIGHLISYYSYYN